jgi:hypothetical protein
MRMIEQEIIQAIRDKKDFSTSKTQDMYRKKEGRRDVITWDEDLFQVCLWGHPIATGDTSAKVLKVSDCGYPTATTKSRLNAVFAAFDIPIACSTKNKKMVYYLNGQETDAYTLYAGEWMVHVTREET